MWELDHRKGWAPKNWCFQTVVRENTLENPLVSKGIKTVNPKGNQPWIFTGRIDAETEVPILWPPDAKSQLTEKTLMLGKTDSRRNRGQQYEVVGWHHWLNGHESEQTPRDLKDREASCVAVHGVAKSQTWWSNWITTVWIHMYFPPFSTTLQIPKSMSLLRLDHITVFFSVFGHTDAVRGVGP